MLQEKDDMIEQLTNELEAKRQEVTEAMRFVADLKEELEISEKKQLAISGERDLLQTKCKDAAFQNITLQETIIDKDEKIEQLQATIEILTSGKNFIKKSYDSLMNKLKRIEEDNFLIPKKKEEKKGNAEAETQSAEAQQNSDGGLSAILQNELRQLHFSLRQKDQIIAEFKREAQAYYSEKQNEGAMTERTSKLAQLIEKDRTLEQGTRQQTDQLLDLITGDASITSEQMSAFHSNFVLLTAQDLQRLMTHRNQMLENKQVLENAKAATLRERDDLMKQLTEQLAKGDIDIEEITGKIVAEKMAAANAVFEEEKDRMNGFLQSKIERNL